MGETSRCPRPESPRQSPHVVTPAHPVGSYVQAMSNTDAFQDGPTRPGSTNVHALPGSDRCGNHKASREQHHEAGTGRPLTASPPPLGTEVATSRTPTPVALWKLNVLRVGYLVMGVGLAVTKWPLLLEHPTWGLAEGTKECLLIAMSFLAVLGLRYPLRMLPSCCSRSPGSCSGSGSSRCPPGWTTTSTGPRAPKPVPSSGS